MSCDTCDQIVAAARQTTPCECASAGYCARHKCDKPAHFAMLCRTHFGYFEQYEQGIGPGQNLPPAQFTLGLGDVSEWLLSEIAEGDEDRLIRWGIRLDRFIEWASRGKFKAANDGTCGCPQRKAWLNRCRLWPLWKRK